jgi:hypothetical protein
MPLYYAFFVDHGGDIYPTRHFASDTDVDAIEAASLIKPPSTTAGFEVWQDDRLIYRIAPTAVSEKRECAFDAVS